MSSDFQIDIDTQALENAQLELKTLVEEEEKQQVYQQQQEALLQQQQEQAPGPPCVHEVGPGPRCPRPPNQGAQLKKPGLHLLSAGPATSKHYR